MFKKKRRKVKPFGLILAIIMALQMMGTTAFAYSARTTAPVANNSYYYSSANPFYSAGFTGNCTWYAWGRAYEILGTSPSLSSMMLVHGIHIMQAMDIIIMAQSLK